MGFWYQATRWWCWGLLPFSWLFSAIAFSRRIMFQKGMLKSTKNLLPVIVVGNISVGGNGKTPFVIWLCELLIKQGYRPGIISRGYGGKSDVYPLLVKPTITGKQAGDEPVMIFKRLGIPVVVDPIRSRAAAYLSDNKLADIIVTDDGLQHYALQRDIEIVIVDGKRRFGNEHLMPMGPLREPLSRLQSVDFVVNNGGQHKDEFSMQLVAGDVLPVDGKMRPFESQGKVNACAAIGYPQRFFDTLEKQQLILNKKVSFADHHPFKREDFNQFEQQTPLLMTEKDAVKCTGFAQSNWWYLPIFAVLPNAFEEQLLKKIKEIK